jgi:hypothetical protein
MPNCRGFGCTSTALIRAHLVPQSFGRLIKSPRGANTRVSERRSTRKLQHGLYDANILCERCDGFLNGSYDQPAFRFIKNFKYLPGELDLLRSHFEKPNIDGDILCLFILSVLWRCSISGLFEVSSINLGPYENPAREVLWGVRPLSRLPAYRVMCQRYHPRRGVDKMYSLPIPAPWSLGVHNWHGFVFVLVGFRFMIVLDPMPLPDQYDSYILNGNTTLRGSLVDFLETYEAREANRLAALHNLLPRPEII